MDKEIKAKWVEALRSGKYEQGTMQLRSHDNKFCCLGVLCDVTDNLQWEEISVLQYRYHNYQYMLPPFLMINYDIARENCVALSRLNDQGKSFEYIAQYIEENL